MHLPKAISHMNRVVHHEDRTNGTIEAFQAIVIQLQEWCPHLEVKAIGTNQSDERGKTIIRPSWHCSYCGARFETIDSLNAFTTVLG